VRQSHRTKELGRDGAGGGLAFPIVSDGCSQRIDLSPIQALVERIVARWRPEQIWLFGSRARGDARASSDWDLLVVVPDDIEVAELDPLVGWRLQKDSGVRADVVPCRSSDFREDRDTPNTLACDAAVEGLLIYER
jgi:predicted nucleotidyltransferase